MSTFDWQRFLETWSQDYIAGIQTTDDLPPEVLESGWLGFPGAMDDQIAAAEARLSIKLPDSYREFLRISNGWRQTTPFIYRVLPIEEVDWFHIKHPDWLDSLRQSNRFSPPSTSVNVVFNGASSGCSIPDAEYFTYGTEQDCSKVRIEYLSQSLGVSEKGESSIYLLNPSVTNAQGEWEAWFFGDWLPGADRYPSFQAMMEAEYQIFLDLRETS